MATSVTAGNAADEDAAAVPATTVAENVAHSVAADVASGNAVDATAVTNPFVDSMLH